MFWTDLLSIIKSLKTVYAAKGVCKLQFNLNGHVYTLVILPTFKLSA